MYIHPKQQEKRTAQLVAFIEENPFGVLIMGPSKEIEANHIPFEIECFNDEKIILRCHVARQNPVWKHLVSVDEKAKETETKPNQKHEILAIFSGANSYISPSWMPGHLTHRKVAPSWLYSAVHAYGIVEVKQDMQWIVKHLAQLTKNHESSRKNPWTFEQAADGFITNAAKYVVGMEVEVTRIMGKYFSGQQYSAATRESIIKGLHEEKGEQGALVASTIQSRSKHSNTQELQTK